MYISKNGIGLYSVMPCLYVSGCSAIQFLYLLCYAFSLLSCYTIYFCIFHIKPFLYYPGIPLFFELCTHYIRSYFVWISGEEYFSINWTGAIPSLLHLTCCLGLIFFLVVSVIAMYEMEGIRRRRFTPCIPVTSSGIVSNKTLPCETLMGSGDQARPQELDPN